MEFSEEWKSLFPIGSSFKPPLLLSSSSLGPLVFNPKPNTAPEIIFSSPSLFPPLLNPSSQLSLSRFLSTSSLPLSTAHSIVSLLGADSYHDPTTKPFLSQNRLQLLHCPDQNLTLVFISTGSNHDQVGYMTLQVKDKKLEVVCDGCDGVFTAKYKLNGKILRILVNPVSDFDDCSGNSSSDAVVGYLMACTLYSVHWFCVKIAKSRKRPIVDYLGCKLFKTSSIVGACWSPHLPQQSVVLLENGALFLFDLETYFKSQKLDAYFKGTRLRVLWNDSLRLENSKWLGCEFSWHPRILIVAGTDAVFLVDFRLDECKIICLANVEMLRLYAPAKKEQFIAFSRAKSDEFHFVLASNCSLLLCDVRKPLMPLLHWAHNVDKPCYITVFKLSELRSKSASDVELANELGFGIVLGSFWNCEFRLFCYGPSFPAYKDSIAPGNSKSCKQYFAWELPSDLFLSGRECGCGSCLVKNEFEKDALPGWIDWRQKKGMLLGFGIINQDLSNLLSESDEFGGFTLVRLVSSGKLEVQRYSASWELVKKLHASHKEPFLDFESNLLYSIEDEEFKFPKKFKYLKLDYLNGYLNGNLAKILESKIRMLSSSLATEYSQEFHEMLCEKLKVCGFGRFRTSPAFALNEISFPTTAVEVALRQMWASLPMEILQLAFSNYTECFDVLMDQNKAPMEFLSVLDIPQLPPFFLRKPSCHSNKWSSKVQLSDSLVGPVLPLAILLTLHELQTGCPDSQDVAYSPKVELGLQCNEIMQMATAMSGSGSRSNLFSDEGASLADDRDEMWVESQNSKPFFIHHPVATKHSADSSTLENHVYRDKNFSTLISPVCSKKVNCNELLTSGVVLFEDLCPIKLKFDVHDMGLESQQLEACNILKKQFSMWQKSYHPYEELCTQSNFGKKDGES